MKNLIKNYSIIFFYSLVLIAACTDSKKESNKINETTEENLFVSKQKGNNEYILALEKIQDTYKNLIKIVDSMTVGFNQEEKQKTVDFLKGTYSLVMESYVDKGNPADPALTVWMINPYRKFAGDNPYTIYTQSPVSIDYEYRLSGKLGNAIYFGVQLYGYAQGFNLPTANIGLQNIKRNPDGTFDLIISKNKPAGDVNWLPLANGDHAFLIRQYFKNRNNIQPADLKIERIDNIVNVPDNYLERLENANRMLTEYIMGTIEVCKILKENALNNYSQPGAEVRSPKYGGSMYPTRDNTYDGFWISLKPGEAIHLHGRLPKKALYSSYVFYDRWYQTPDYRNINCFRTGDEISLNNDGSYDLYISPERVNHPNWIDTGGLYEGSYSSRYLVSTDKDFPTVKVVKIVEINK